MSTTPDELRRVVEFQRGVARRRAGRTERTRFGLAVFDDGLPLVYYLNTLLVELGARPSAGQLVAEVEEIQNRAALAHRKLEIDEEELAVVLEPALVGAGYESQRFLVMVHRGDFPPAAEARRVPPGALLPAWRREEGLRPEEVEQLVAAHAVTAGAVDTSYFACEVGGKVVSYCELYSAGGLGQIEMVNTLEPFRNRGLGTAVVSAALEDSRRVGNDLHFLVADERDWPKEWYRKLGFEGVGRTWSFVRKPSEEQA